jgi:hypothetical protein
MSAHTPGPWTWRMGPSNLYRAHERRLITKLHCDDGGSAAPIAKMDEAYGGDYLVAEANARLLAAAPQMLEALKTANAAINPSDRQGISLLTWNERLKVATVAIHAAIVKAEGR